MVDGGGDDYCANAHFDGGDCHDLYGSAAGSCHYCCYREAAERIVLADGDSYGAKTMKRSCTRRSKDGVRRCYFDSSYLNLKLSHEQEPLNLNSFSYHCHVFKVSEVAAVHYCCL